MSPLLGEPIADGVVAPLSGAFPEIESIDSNYITLFFSIAGKERGILAIDKIIQLITS